MDKQFFKGIINTLIYYVSGAALALLAHLFFHDTYTLARGSKLYHLILVATWLGGCLWMLYGIFKFMKGQRKSYYFGVVILNLLIVFSVFAWVYYLQSTTPEEALLI